MLFNGKTLFATGTFSGGGADAAGAQWIDKNEDFQAWLAQTGSTSAIDYLLTLTAAGAYTVKGGWYCVVYNTGGASTQHEIMQIDDENRHEWLYIMDVLIAECAVTTDGADVALLQFTVGGKDLASAANSVGIKTVKAEERENGVYIEITLTDGNATTFTVPRGQQGEKGEKGADGQDGSSVTVSSVSESTADGGSNVVTFSDGTTLTVKNGSKGSTGEKGADGQNGYTPKKGLDYFTAQDVETIVTSVYNRIADGNGVAY